MARSTIWYSGPDFPPGLMVEIRMEGAEVVCDQVRKAEAEIREAVQLKRTIQDQQREIRTLQSKLEQAHAVIRRLNAGSQVRAAA